MASDRYSLAVIPAGGSCPSCGYPDPLLYRGDHPAPEQFRVRDVAYHSKGNCFACDKPLELKEAQNPAKE